MTSTPKSYRELRLILGDQLNAGHSWFQAKDEGVLYLIAELHQETEYVRHHVQKICAFFTAMKGFGEALQAAGHEVLYLTLDDTAAFDGLPGLLDHLVERHQVRAVRYQQPDEYRLHQQLGDYADRAAVPVACNDTDHFLLSRDERAKWFPASKRTRMEIFYRKMRQKTGVLMHDGEPEGGRWNFDAENRERLRKEDLAKIPEPLVFAHPVDEILARLDRHKVNYFGKVADPLPWPCSRREARTLLAYFCERLLPHFGRFQDAMTDQSPHAWSLYHSRLSFALNTKILSPREVIEAVERCYYDPDHPADLAQVEGFIRQILGWREYVRGLYWAHMPDYASLNTLEATRSLPAYFWTGETRMACLHQALTQSLETAYAHHIQRLMVIGNFCLLAGIHPDQVDEWYLGVYVDALEWVEMPNTRGMSQFADGGIVGSKPYAASGNYVKKMSDYCQGCHYRVAERTGEMSCPLNSLYWHFMDRNRQRVKNNPRTAMVMKGWDKRAKAEREAILSHADHLLGKLESL